MERKKDSPEELLKIIAALGPLEFLGVCKILGVKIYKEKEKDEEKGELDVECGPAIEGRDETKDDRPPREFRDIWYDVCDTVFEMNRTRRRTLGKLVRAAVKK